MSQTIAQPQDIKLFQKWTFKDISVVDIGLQRYLNLTPMVAPHSMGRHEHQRFRKAKVNVVERLINGLMRSGKNQRQKSQSNNIVKEAFEIINLRTGKIQLKSSLKQSKTLLHAKTQPESATEELSTTYPLTLHHNAE